jgi:hypothetical protein
MAAKAPVEGKQHSRGRHREKGIFPRDPTRAVTFTKNLPDTGNQRRLERNENAYGTFLNTCGEVSLGFDIATNGWNC